MNLLLSEAERERLVDLVNALGGAVRGYDDATVTREVEDAGDELRDAAHELHHFLVSTLVRPDDLFR